MGVMKVIYGAFFIVPLYFIIFLVIYSSLFYHFLVIYSSLFYQNIVSLHADVLYFFSDLNKIIELCIYNER